MKRRMNAASSPIAPAVLGAVFCLAPVACSDGAVPRTAGSAIACAVDGSSAFAEECTMERHSEEGGETVIVRHADGAFRRLSLGDPEAGIVTADGAQVAETRRGGGYVEVRVGDDRYRLPVRPAG